MDKACILVAAHWNGGLDSKHHPASPSICFCLADLLHQRLAEEEAGRLVFSANLLRSVNFHGIPVQ